MDIVEITSQRIIGAGEKMMSAIIDHRRQTITTMTGEGNIGAVREIGMIGIEMTTRKVVEMTIGGAIEIAIGVETEVETATIEEGDTLPKVLHQTAQEEEVVANIESNSDMTRRLAKRISRRQSWQQPHK